ncbi:T-complex protein 1 subunit theta-like [Convolutriloba macropyga]|uniref:T-complex protein 1 subunit theta-like n=1 Tax=Convolutriloba macropyga TaxID=536237 RepID=UPI003F5250A7
MAMSVPLPPGFASMLKDGAKHYQGLDEAVYRNIEACKELAKTTRSAFGPNGMNKIVINHIEKLFVTSDTATILSELEVQHPAAKLLVLASQQQEKECGDGTNLVLILAGALLEEAEELLRMGLSPTEVIEGYEKAMDKALEYLGELKGNPVQNLRDETEVARAVNTSVCSKQYGYEDFLSELIAKACISSLPADKMHFNVDHVRICKILGSSLLSSEVCKGMVFKRETETTRDEAVNAKVAVYSCPIELLSTETKGTVLINNAEELKSFSKGEENAIEQRIKDIVDSGVEVVVAGGKVHELALHYLNLNNILVVRVPSKFDLRRVARVTKSTILTQLVRPSPEDIGFINSCYLTEIGETNCVVMKQTDEDSKIATIIIRGSTDSLMDDVERAIDDGVNTFKALTRDASSVPGAGAAEISLALKLQKHAETCPGMEQYSIKKFADALEAVPKALAENCGVKSAEVLSQLYAAHQAGGFSTGVDIESELPSVTDTNKPSAPSGGDSVSSLAPIRDSYYVKWWALKFATKAACTVLQVDQIIMAKPAGGPKAKGPQGDNDDD